MGDNSKEDTSPLARKRIVLIELPEESAFFLDNSNDGSYYIRVEGLNIRYIFPIGDNIQHKIGSLVDEFIEAIGPQN